MNKNPLLKFAIVAAAIVSSLSAILSAQAQTVTWNRQALGQQKTDPCGNMFSWPNNNDWDQQKVDSTACNQTYVAQPSNWSTPTFPNGSGVDVILTAPTAPVSLDI